MLTEKQDRIEKLLAEVRRLKGSPMEKNKVIIFRVEKEMKDWLEFIAKSDGTTVSKMLRGLIARQRQDRMLSAVEFERTKNNDHN